MRSLEDWRQYLLGARHTFEIITDHSNLTYYREPQKLTRRQARWFLELQEYDFKLIHRSGTLNAKADILSRRADHERGENDNSNIVLLKPEWFVNELLVEALDADFISRIKSSKNNKDRVVTKALANNEEDWEEQEDGMVVWQDLIYVPRNKKLREDIIKCQRLTSDALNRGHRVTLSASTRKREWRGNGP